MWSISFLELNLKRMAKVSLSQKFEITYKNESRKFQKKLILKYKASV